MFYEGSLPDIKQLYDVYCRSNDCPFIEFFTFHKLMPFTTEVSRHVFDSYASGDSNLLVTKNMSISSN